MFCAVLCSNDKSTRRREIQLFTKVMLEVTIELDER